MTDQERLGKIDVKLDRLMDVVNSNHAESMKSHGILEGQDLDGRLKKIETKFWPAVGAAAIVIPISTWLAVVYMGG